MACLCDGGDKFFFSIMKEFTDQMNIVYRYVPLLVIIHGISTIEMTRQFSTFVTSLALALGTGYISEPGLTS
jgi:hypothetical protein